jgi:hypothetical protein
MNFPKLFEGALAQTIMEHAALTDLPRIRTWQAIDADARWTPTADRVFPLIDIRTGPPRVSADDGVTCLCTVTVLVGTHKDDDPTHADLARYYEATQTVLDALYAQFRAGAAGAERLTFDRHIADAAPDVVPIIGGFEHGEPLDPYDDAGGQYIGMMFVVHFARSDF